MEKVLHQHHDFSFTRVPLSARHNLFILIMVRIGIMTALGQFMLGALLGHSMPFHQAMLATFLGSMLLEVVSLGLGIAAAREGLSTSLLALWGGFGRYGSALVSVLIALSLIGWFGVQNAILSHGVNYALDNQPGFTMSAVISGLGITALMIFGFRALGWIAVITVPLFMLVVGWIVIKLLSGYDLMQLATSFPTGEPMTLGMAATAVAGGYIVTATTTADIARYCQKSHHVFWMVTVSIIVGEFFINGIAILIAHAMNTSDVVTIMTQSAGWLGLLAVILSAVKINDSNLYSSTLALANAIERVSKHRMSYVKLTIILGFTGTLLTIAGILEKFTHFLVLLGIVFPPIAGVILCDYFLLKNHKKELDLSRDNQCLPDPAMLPAIGWYAIIACLSGVLAGLIITVGIPSLNSLLISIMVYRGFHLLPRLGKTK
ncbi:cytosine permease [Candidatus Symbiopectobacterium sp. NZEC151]|uniref:cytosine permease n=2 Tax=unclassified Symbiopectobacterium TaxID=2794573 RepID=UPI0022261A1E|nr:cytosine permease [Candidatus Symbiopectobacterium sp. NZEC151]MCW2477210.1 cytosine permease [Candidatus Symbiopectobacterium sp. NZEC151]